MITKNGCSIFHSTDGNIDNFKSLLSILDHDFDFMEITEPKKEALNVFKT